MAYASTEQLRALTPFGKGEISDDNVAKLIPLADRHIIQLATEEVYLEQLQGSINGTNTEFRTKHAPIAEADADEDVDAEDVTVYYATNTATENNLDYGAAQTVTDVESENGIINMTTAPTTTTAEAGVFAIYRYIKNRKINYDLLKDASNYYLAYLCAQKISGSTSNYQQIKDGWQRRWVTEGADYKRMAYEILDLVDPIVAELS